MQFKAQTSQLPNCIVMWYQFKKKQQQQNMFHKCIYNLHWTTKKHVAYWRKTHFLKKVLCVFKYDIRGSRAKHDTILL